MSSSKRLRFGPEDPRAKAPAAQTDRIEQARNRLTEPVALRRKNPLFGARWDPLWRTCVLRAANDLGIEHIRINERLFVRDEAAAKHVTVHAQNLWRSLADRLQRISKQR